MFRRFAALVKLRSSATAKNADKTLSSSLESTGAVGWLRVVAGAVCGPGATVASFVGLFPIAVNGNSTRVREG